MKWYMTSSSKSMHINKKCAFSEIGKMKAYSVCVRHRTYCLFIAALCSKLRKIAKFYLISSCENFVESAVFAEL